MFPEPIFLMSNKRGMFPVGEVLNIFEVEIKAKIAFKKNLNKSLTGSKRIRNRTKEIKRIQNLIERIKNAVLSCWQMEAENLIILLNMDHQNKLHW